MTTNIYKFTSRRDIEFELNKELLDKLDRCMELCLMLEGCSAEPNRYRKISDYVHRSFICVEDLEELF
jgi:hypothetical protein